jgi:hypothetical protein
MLRGVILAVILVLPMSGLVSADTITYFTPPGAMVGGLPVNAAATFTTSAGTVAVTLWNNEADPTGVIQNLSDLRFTLATGEMTGTLTSSSGLERTVHSGGTYTDGLLVATGWQLETNPLRLHVLGTPTAPAHTVLGLPGVGDLYNNANPSIAGNGPHNPFLTGPISFTMSIPGVTDLSTISSAVFSFGTSEGNDVPGIPEPATAALVGVGTLLVVLRRRTA